MEKYKNSELSAKERAKDLLGRMTKIEKIGQLNQRLYGFHIYERQENQIILKEEFKNEVKRYSGLGVLYGLHRADPWSGRTEETGLKGTLSKSTYNMVQKYVLEHSRLGIPMLMSSECPHGHQALDGYILPVNLGVGATFNKELLKKAGKVCGKQLKEMGVHLALVSTLDILRDPRWGRSEECFSEDPYLASVLGKAIVEGVQSEKVGVVAKHFCAQGEGTGGINASAARIGERELREIHLPAAKMCCDAGVQGIMAAYNEIDGIYCHANRRLLTGILREEYGFQGVVMADGVAIDQLDKITGDNVLSGALALKAGVDIGLWDLGFSKLEEALHKGFLSEENINDAVLRVLILKFQQGLFEHPFIEENQNENKYTYENYPESLELARESIVLLKNENNTLPLTNSMEKIALLGPNADNIYNQIGDYSPPLAKGVGKTVLEGMQNNGFEILYGDGADIVKSVEIAISCETVVLVLGGSSNRFTGVDFDINGAAIVTDGIAMDCGEGVDSGKLELPGNQMHLFEEVYKLGKKMITIMIGGRPYAMEEIAEKTNALLYSFYPGPMGGQAISEIIFGKLSPSGRLPVSIPRNVGQLPVYYNYKSSYAGIKYYDLKKAPLYQFGEGFGYSQLEYKDIKVEVIKTSVKIFFNIENKGDFDEFAVPQLYRKIMASSVVPRVCELKGFVKVLIQKGEKRQVCLELGKEDFSVWDHEMAFTFEGGQYELTLKDSGKEIWKSVVVLD
ncbi:MAG TPA: glycoside hydrolase family 3 N-terminal domain-containing protein [Lachnospiraceae bacterium]|nr:glycoside hydrolase family 3 N-terminal domain-containing protein [Lachnospiraceae bacterium]